MDDYNLRITDIDWAEESEYEVDTGARYIVRNQNLFKKESGRNICLGHDLAEIAELRFKKATDWSKVPVDTKILVRDRVEDMWVKRHFAKYRYKTVFAFTDGTTSYTAIGLPGMWDYAKLAEGEEE